MPVYFYDINEKPYGCFSNFSRHGFELDGEWWRTSEHYFQAQKFAGSDNTEVIRKLLKPREALDLARQLNHLVRPDWLQVRDDVMRKAVERKFESNPDIRSVLVSTGDALLVENSPIDSYWGCGANGNGKNMLGKILMEVRGKLQYDEQLKIKQAKTSDTHPIHVDFLPSELIGGKGRIGMTFAPGKKHQGKAGLWYRDLSQDLAYLRQHYNTDFLVSLIEEYELYLLQIPNLLTEVEAQGIRSKWFPIKDRSVPESMQELRLVIEEIIDRKQHEQTIVIHCMGGLGRTGLVAACCLVYLGHSAADAISYVRQTRPGTIQTQKQEKFIFDFAGTKGR